MKKWIWAGVGIGLLYVPVFLPKLLKKKPWKVRPKAVGINPGEKVNTKVRIKNTGSESNAFGVESMYKGPITAGTCGPSESLNPNKEDTVEFTWDTSSTTEAGYYDLDIDVYENSDCSGDKVASEYIGDAIKIKEVPDYEFEWVKVNGTQVYPTNYGPVSKDAGDVIDVDVKIKNTGNSSKDVWLGWTIHNKGKTNNFYYSQLPPKKVSLSPGETTKKHFSDSYAVKGVCDDIRCKSCAILYYDNDTYELIAKVWDDYSYDDGCPYDKRMEEPVYANTGWMDVIKT